MSKRNNACGYLTYYSSSFSLLTASPFVFRIVWPAFEVVSAWRLRLQDIDHWISQQACLAVRMDNAAETNRGGES